MLFVRTNGRKLARARIRFQVERRILEREEIRRKSSQIGISNLRIIANFHRIGIKTCYKVGKFHATKGQMSNNTSILANYSPIR
ncbi:unnamed protein product [Onchocerca flexuosa]|uniref:HTH_Tnp_Tc3_1 domain-containing protein n=1 Tax=Onchocerca flexuosa TaxID=387005 RepID=A0A183HNJ3_9BILA|nr:unnamed protein product [Onchocerca flexuosa]